MSAFDELRAKLANRDQIIADVIRGKLAKTSPMYSAELTAAMQALKSVQQERDSLKAKLSACERQEPVAWAWNDALGCMHAHCGSRRPVWVDGECSDAKRAESSLRPLYAAPPIPRVEQEPVAWVLFDDIFAPEREMPDDLREFAHRCGLYHWALAVWTNGYAAGMRAVIQADPQHGDGK